MSSRPPTSVPITPSAPVPQSTPGPISHVTPPVPRPTAAIPRPLGPIAQAPVPITHRQPVPYSIVPEISGDHRRSRFDIGPEILSKRRR